MEERRGSWCKTVWQWQDPIKSCFFNCATISKRLSTVLELAVVNSVVESLWRRKLLSVALQNNDLGMGRSARVLCHYSIQSQVLYYNHRENKPENRKLSI